MSEEKVRTSGERERAEAEAEVLPTVNPAVAKAEPPKSAVPAAVYIAYVVSHCYTKSLASLTCPSTASGLPLVLQSLYSTSGS